MATDPVRPEPTRRRCLQAGLALAGLLGGGPRAWAAAQAGPALRLAAAWERPATSGPRAWELGVLGLDATGTQLRVLARRAVPGRAHGLWRDAQGQLLAVARRPGLWLQRWTPGGELLAEAWAAPGRQFNGHVLATPDGRVFTTEIDHATGEGCVVQRDGRTLAEVALWPTGGQDPHEMLWLGDGQLLVANGGIRATAATGRAKLDLDRMDSSLARIDVARRGGPVLWTLDDPRLSLRHLDRHAASGVVGVSLQAQHDDPVLRAEAPLLALFDGQALRLAGQPRALAGYGGDILATDDGFWLSATEAGGVAHWSAQGRWQGWLPLTQPCPLARWAPGTPLARCLVGGAEAALSVPGDGQGVDGGQPLALPEPGLRLDNHWIAWTA